VFFHAVVVLSEKIICTDQVSKLVIFFKKSKNLLFRNWLEATNTIVGLWSFFVLFLFGLWYQIFGARNEYYLSFIRHNDKCWIWGDAKFRLVFLSTAAARFYGFHRLVASFISSKSASLFLIILLVHSRNFEHKKAASFLEKEAAS